MFWEQFGGEGFSYIVRFNLNKGEHVLGAMGGTCIVRYKLGWPEQNDRQTDMTENITLNFGGHESFLWGH